MARPPLLAADTRRSRITWLRVRFCVSADSISVQISWPMLLCSNVDAVETNRSGGVRHWRECFSQSRTARHADRWWVGLCAFLDRPHGTRTSECLLQGRLPRPWLQGQRRQRPLRPPATHARRVARSPSAAPEARATVARPVKDGSRTPPARRSRGVCRRLLLGGALRRRPPGIGRAGWSPRR